MRRRFVLTALIAAWSGAGDAQSLDYGDVLDAEHAVGPRLIYRPVDDLPPDLPEPVRAEAPSGHVRSFYGDRFEGRPRRGGTDYSWDVSGEIGSARDRLWLATAGNGATNGAIDYIEAQALWSRPVLAAGLAVQAGVRRDFVRPRRSYAVLGAQGNVSAPLYVGAFGFLSTKGELSGRLYAYYDQPLALGLIAQPFVGTELAARDVPELGLGAGFTELELGLRLRVRFDDAVAPYLGVSWDRLTGRTARFARQAGDEVESTSFVLGVRSYF